MRNLPIITLLTLSAATSPLFAGEDAVARKEFRQSGSYPFVFRSDSYLAGTGPAPMRFAPAAPLCPQRNAPPLLGAAKGAAKPDSSAATKNPAEAGAANGSATAPAPVHPAPENAPQPPRDDIDFARVPGEVLDFFKNTEGRPVRRAYLFDPIFQPAVPNELPKSKATYQKK